MKLMDLKEKTMVRKWIELQIKAMKNQMNQKLMSQKMKNKIKEYVPTNSTTASQTKLFAVAANENDVFILFYLKIRLILHVKEIKN